MLETQRRSPYQGLMPFEIDDASFFFGRDRETRIIVANLFAAPLTLLYGASGVGKTSVLRAGVIQQLRQRDDLFVVWLNIWQGDLLNKMKTIMAETTMRTINESINPAESVSLVEYLNRCISHFHRRIMIIFDQFEEYFLYHERDNAFAIEFPQVLAQAGLPVSFLISIREDSLAKLDRFEGRIPNLFDNYLRLEHLDQQAAGDAIIGPVAQYNRLFSKTERQFSVEPELARNVIDQTKIGQELISEVPHGKTAVFQHDVIRVETPYLQLVMMRLWDVEIHNDSHILRVETLNRLGGAKKIVRTHLDSAMNFFSLSEQNAAARVFYYLVTPSGTKITHSLRDLSEYTGIPDEVLKPVLNKLTGAGIRILRLVSSAPDQPMIPRYEIFHDVLASAILEWRMRFLETQRLTKVKKEVKKDYTFVFILLIIIIVILLGYISSGQSSGCSIIR